MDVHDLRPRWYIMIGTQYIAGLGKTFSGYRNEDSLPMTPGLVITGIERRAMLFTSRREAARLANSIGGRMVRVTLTQEEPPRWHGNGSMRNKP